MTDRSTAAIARGVLLGTLAGDALGAPFEGADAVEIDHARQRLAQVLARPRLPYTDDTQLTLALAEHLCDHPHVEAAHLVSRFLDHFEDHRGYARGMFGVVDAWRAGTPPQQAATAVFPDGSFGNGAAMRVAPVGVVWRDDPAALDSAARRQAALTHTHPIGTDGAAAQARAVATAAGLGEFTVMQLGAVAAEAQTPQLRRALETAQVVARQHIDREQPLPAVAEAVGTGVLADQSVPAALWVAAVARTFEDVIVLSLGLGGDVDTIAAMAGAVVGAAWTDAAIPPAWLVRMEDGPRGLAYARELALRLAAVADAQAADQA